MKRIVIASGQLPSCEFQSIAHGDEILHRIRVTGKIDLERRLPLYHRTLAVNRTSNYFCILDNSGGHENVLSYPDMVILDEILVEGGIRTFYGVTVTHDSSYSGIVKLASYSAEASRLQTELVATNDPAEAERFIQEKLASLGG